MAPAARLRERERDGTHGNRGDRILDLDHFKRLNDTLGHQQGDLVLRVLGQVLGDSVRARDIAGRLGGEEFVVVLSTEDGTGAEVFLERLRARWEAVRPHAVTFSAGIARVGAHPERSLRQADTAMYRAKAAGRDRWCWGEDDAPEGHDASDVPPVTHFVALSHVKVPVAGPQDLVAAFHSRLRAVDAWVGFDRLEVWEGARLVDAAHRNHLPALVGGSALTAERAAALGADGWAPDAATAVQRLRSWRDRPPTVDPAPTILDPDALALDARAGHLAERAFDDLTRRSPPMLDYDARQLQRTREDLAYIVHYLAAARLVDDPSVFVEFRGWLTELLIARDVPAEALTAGIASLAPLVRPIDAAAHRLATT